MMRRKREAIRRSRRGDRSARLRGPDDRTRSMGPRRQRTLRERHAARRIHRRAVALIILILVFGAVVAAGIPLLLAIVSIVVAVGMVALIWAGYETELPRHQCHHDDAGSPSASTTRFHRATLPRGAVSRGMEKLAAIERGRANRVVPCCSRAAQWLWPSSPVHRAIECVLEPGDRRRARSRCGGRRALTLFPRSSVCSATRFEWLSIPGLGNHATDHSGGFWARVSRFVMAHRSRALSSPARCWSRRPSRTSASTPDFRGSPRCPRAASRARRSRSGARLLGGLVSPTEVVVDAQDVQSRTCRDALASPSIKDRQATAASVQRTIEYNDANDLGVLSAVWPRTRRVTRHTMRSGACATNTCRQPLAASTRRST